MQQIGGTSSEVTGRTPGGTDVTYKRFRNLVIGVVVFFLSFFVVLGILSAVRHIGWGDPSTIRDQQTWIGQTAISLFVSVFGAAIFYLIWVGFKEEKLFEIIGMQTAEKIKDRFFFESGFNRIMPIKVYPEHEEPQRGFDEMYMELLLQSSFLLFRSSSGPYLSYRLSSPSFRRLVSGKEIMLLFDDPRDELSLRSRAIVEANQQSNPTPADIEAGIKQRQEKCFVTLVALWDIHEFVRKIHVAFKPAQNYFRAEIFSKGLFLTYYINRTWSDTYLYEPGQLNYDVYEWSFLQHHQNSNFKIIYQDLNQENKEQEFINMLNALGCTLSLAELHAKKEERFAWYRKNPTKHIKP